MDNVLTDIILFYYLAFHFYLGQNHGTSLK